MFRWTRFIKLIDSFEDNVTLTFCKRYVRFFRLGRSSTVNYFQRFPRTHRRFRRRWDRNLTPMRATLRVQMSLFLSFRNEKYSPFHPFKDVFYFYTHLVAKLLSNYTIIDDTSDVAVAWWQCWHLKEACISQYTIWETLTSDEVFISFFVFLLLLLLLLRGKRNCKF